MCLEVDIIVPVHNAATTIEEAVESAMHQEIPKCLLEGPSSFPCSISLTVCCYDDASTDDSLGILQRLQERYGSCAQIDEESSAKLLGEDTHQNTQDPDRPNIIPSRLLVCSSIDGRGRGAGYARNRAIEMNNPSMASPEKATGTKFLCFLDSDDVMHKHRVAEQSHYLLSIQDEAMRDRTLLGCTFVRDPPDSTWHYSDWANNLSDERLMLERFREVTVLQPTWFMPYSAWASVGGYVEAPPQGSDDSVQKHENNQQPSPNHRRFPCLIHPKYDTPETLRLAEDLRFFHALIQLGGTVRLHRTKEPLVTYRHALDSSSQSFRTSRKFLLQLRALAFEWNILRRDPKWHHRNGGKFVIWGAGRDGKEFFKALHDDLKRRVYCFVDVDAKKLNAGYYVHRPQEGNSREITANDGAAPSTLKVPIVHFSYLINDRKKREQTQAEFQEDGRTETDAVNGRIDKGKRGGGMEKGKSIQRPPSKKQKLDRPKPRCMLHLRGLSQDLLERLPVVICVAMYRTNGVLERNVTSIGRIEGRDLWHFS